MKNINEFWDDLKFLIVIIWVLFTINAVILAYEGHMVTLNIVLTIDLIIAIYYIIINKENNETL